MTWREGFTAFIRWFDAGAGAGAQEASVSEVAGNNKIDWPRVLPFLAFHAMCLGIVWVGWSPVAVGVAVFFYGLRMFAITGFYHRYFSHRSFKTTRLMQFFFGVLGATSVQRGPLWWAAHHRHHHQHSDEDHDRHSPLQHGFLWSHMGWFLSKGHFSTNRALVKDLAKFPELEFLDRFDIIAPFYMGAFCYYLGMFLQWQWPMLGTTPMQMLIWGFFVSTTFLFHGTFTINSLAHLFGRKRYVTGDESRNNFWLSLITLGEGWHNNHHYYPHAARQGFYWWEIDVTYYILKMLSWFGLVWDLKDVPRAVRDRRIPQSASLPGATISPTSA